MNININTYYDWYNFVSDRKDYFDFLSNVFGQILFYEYLTNRDNILIFIPNSVYGIAANRNVHVFYTETELKIYHSDNIYTSELEEMVNLITISIPEFCQIIWSILHNEVPKYSKDAIDICHVLLGIFLDIPNFNNFRGTILFRDFMYHKDHFSNYINIIPITHKTNNFIEAAISWKYSNY